MRGRRVRISIRVWVFLTCLVVSLSGIYVIYTLASVAAKEVILTHELVDLRDDSNVTIAELRQAFRDLEGDLYVIRSEITEAGLGKAKPPNGRLRSRRHAFEVTVGDGSDPLNWFENKGKLKVLESDQATKAQFVQEIKNSDVDRPMISPPLRFKAEGRKEGARDVREHIGFYGGIRAENGSGSQMVILMAICPVSFNRFMRSPRHMTFILDASGSTLLWSSGQSGIDISTSYRQLAEIQRKFSEWWKDPPDQEDRGRGNLMDYRNKDNAIDTERGAFPDLPFFHRLSQKLDLENASSDQIANIEQSVAEPLRKHGFSVTSPSATDPRFRIRYHSDSEFEKIHAEIEKSLASNREVASLLGGRVEWEAPLDCKDDGRYSVHCSRIALNPTEQYGDPQRYFDVMNCVSALELENDAYVAIRQKLQTPALVLTAVLLACALALSVYITRPIQQITQAARTVARDGEMAKVEDDLPTGNRSEIGELAQTFHNLILSGRERTHRLVEQAERLEGQTQKLKDAEIRLLGILDNAAEGIITVDAEDRISTANSAALKLLKMSMKKVHDLYLRQILKDQESGSGFSIARFLDTGGSSSKFSVKERATLCQRGSNTPEETLPVEVSVSKFRDNDEYFFTLIIRDIRDQLRTEKELKEKQQLSDALLLRSQGMSQIVHELRSPLYVIQSALGRLREHLDGEGKSDLRSAEGSVDDIKEVIESLRNLKRTGLTSDNSTNSHERSWVFSLNELIDDVNKNKSYLRHQRRSPSSYRIDVIREVQPNLPLIEGEIEDFREVLINLMSNACKYTRKDGSGTVRVTARYLPPKNRQKHGTIRIEVSDNGLGIAPEDQDKIFREFFRTPGAKGRDKKGLGIGLAICKQIITRYGGMIDFDSDGLNEGATFWFEVPIRQTPVYNSRAVDEFREPVRDALASDVILIGTKDRTVGEILQQNLEVAGLSFMVQSDAEEILEELKQSKTPKYRLIFLTPFLECLNGFMAARAIHEIESCRDISIVIVGSTPRVEAQENAGDQWYENERCLYMSNAELLDEMTFWKFAHQGLPVRIENPQKA